MLCRFVRTYQRVQPLTIGELPPEAHKNIIFADYRLRAQRRWSRALLRHEINARAALAAVLDRSPENILVRAHDL